MNVILVFLVVNFFVLDLAHAFNETCASDDTCSVTEKTICLNNVCTCDKLLMFNESLGKCVKYATEYGAICYDDLQCTPFMGNISICTSNRCRCKENYRWFQGKCQQYVTKGNNCTDDSICLDPYNPLSLTCTNDTNGTKTCQCSDGYYDRGEDCRLISESEECAISMDCQKSTNYCQIGKCVTDFSVTSARTSNFNFGKYNYLHSNFVIEEDTNNTCPDGVISSFNETECKKCHNTTYFMDSSCICRQGFFLQEGKCIPELGMVLPSVTYNNDSDCSIKPGKLGEDGACYCGKYWFQSNDNRECKKTTLQYTKNCMDNDWCRAMGPWSYCHVETGKCECISQATLNETSFFCELNNHTIEGCLTDSACALYETCIDLKCQCIDGFYKDPESALCLPKIGSSCEVRECTHIDHATCSADELCECEKTHNATDGLKCLEPTKNVGGECQIEEQCENIAHTTCTASNNTISHCLCTEEYLDVKGTCFARKYPNSLCSTRKECTIILGDTFVCRNMMCQCPIGKSLSKENVCVSNSTNVSKINNLLAFALALLLILRV